MTSRRWPGTREGHLAELFDAAGLRDIEATTLTASLEHPTFEEWWEPFTRGVGPAGSYLAGSTRIGDPRCASAAAPAPGRAVRVTAGGVGGPRSRLTRPVGGIEGLVPHTGFEPVISALRGRCPGPLDECGPVGRACSPGRSA